MRLLVLLENNFSKEYPILLEEIYKINKPKSKATTRKDIKRLIDAKKLKRVCRGAYCFSDCSFLPEDVMEKRFITDGKEVYGYYNYLTLLNKMGTQWQIVFTSTIYSNKISKLHEGNILKDKYIPYRILKPKVKITKENVMTLSFLEAVSYLDEVNDVKDDNMVDYFVVEMFKNKVDKDLFYKYLPLFPETAIKTFNKRKFERLPIFITKNKINIRK